MTDNTQGWAKAGIHSINHVGLLMPDLAEASRFMHAFGLRVEQRGQQLNVRASASEHVWLRVQRGDKKQLAFVSVGCYAEDYLQICQQIEAAGGQPASAHALGSDDGYWFRDPHGTLLQLRVAPKMMPDQKTPMADRSVPAGVQGAAFRDTMATVAPTRLAHMLMFTPDVQRSVEFYEQALGVRVADRSADLVAFTYARHGCDHHLLAFVKSDGIGVHHTSWDLPAIEDLGIGAAQMRNAGFPYQWGLGRHVLGSNYFNYVRDQAGKWWEYNCHIDYIPAGMPWQGGDHPPENSFYLWGPDLPSDFAVNGEA